MDRLQTPTLGGNLTSHLDLGNAPPRVLLATGMIQAPTAVSKIRRTWNTKRLSSVDEKRVVGIWRRLESDT